MIEQTADKSKLNNVHNELWQSLWPEVYRFVYYKVQNREEAEELTQEILKKVFTQVEKNNVNRDKIRSYTFTAARNMVCDRWRKKSTKVILLPMDESYPCETGPEDVYDTMEQSLVVKEAQEFLPQIERDILVLRIVEGYSVNKVSEITGKPPGTIKSIQYRALQKLRKHLLKGGYFNE